MKKIILYLSILVSFNTLSADEISLKESEFVHKIAETIDALHENKGVVWKDYDLSDTPLIITFSNGHIYAFQLKSKHPAWLVKYVDAVPVLFSDEDHWGITDISMQDKFVVDGVETFVFNIDENHPNKFQERPLLVLVHEIFHRYQFAHFKPISNFGAYVDQHNIENLQLIQLEERILIDFLRATTDKNKLNLLKDFVAVHQIRADFMDPSSLQWESVQQIMEGLADYTSIQTFEHFSVIPGFNRNKYLQATLASYIYSEDPQELAVKWRHYGVGATLGVALDFLDVKEWKELIERGEESQISLLEKTIILSDVEKEKRFQEVKEYYNYDEISETIQKKTEKFQALLDNILINHAVLDGTIITLNRPKEMTINGGGTSCGIYHLDDGVSVSVQDTSFSATTDNLWKLTLNEIPFLFQNGAGERILKVDHDLVIFLDNRPYSIQQLKEQKEPISFETIAWNCKTSTFESQARGGRVDGLSIMFD